jgi:hypothetical protein
VVAAEGRRGERGGGGERKRETEKDCFILVLWGSVSQAPRSRQRDCMEEDEAGEAKDEEEEKHELVRSAASAHLDRIDGRHRVEEATY